MNPQDPLNAQQPQSPQPSLPEPPIQPTVSAPEPSPQLPAYGPAPVVAPDNPTAQVSSPSYISPAPGGKSKRLALIGVGLVLLIAGGVGAFMLSGKQDNAKSSGTSQQSSTDKKPAANSVTADDLYDFGIVCQGGTVTNAAAYEGGPSPHRMVLLVPGLREGAYSLASTVSFTDLTWAADYKNPSSTQLVGCFERASATITKQCEVQNSDKQKISLNYYSVNYTLTTFEAKTGKQLGSTDISGPAVTCPYFATYSPSDPKIYADPDRQSSINAVQPFIVKP